MAGLLERLGGLFGRRTEAPPAEPPPAEAPPADVAPVETAEAPPAEVTAAAPEYNAPWSAGSAEAAPVEAAAAPAADAPAYIPVSERAWNQPVADTYTPPPVAAPAEAPVAAAPPELVKSAEEELEERLWADVEAAWGREDYQKVTESLDALKALEPEDAVAIDEKIAAAQFNHGTQLERSGELQRALFLFQDAQRRNPNLGEAAFAIERVQNALAPAPAEAAPVEAAPVASAPAERTYTVEAGDSLWAIAEKVYGSGNDWSRIFEANSDQIANPDAIQPGQILRIP
jgi:tetratricopeptide (TPR) repeat protein